MVRDWETEYSEKSIRSPVLSSTAGCGTDNGNATCKYSSIWLWYIWLFTEVALYSWTLPSLPISTLPHEHDTYSLRHCLCICFCTVISDTAFQTLQVIGAECACRNFLQMFTWCSCSGDPAEVVEHSHYTHAQSPFLHVQSLCVGGGGSHLYRAMYFTPDS